MTLANSQRDIHCGTLPNSGEATSIASGGTGNYLYHWSSTGSTVDSATSLTVGAYTITVTDANGCTATNTFHITQSATLTQSATQTNVTCSDSSNGTITVSVYSTTGPFTYVWSPTVTSQSSATGLTAGNYTVQITDTAGCHSTLQFTITSPTALVDLDSFKAPLCNAGANGMAVVYVTGGTPGYAYQWTPTGGSNDTASGLTAGTYIITVRDSNGCTVSDTVHITQPPALTMTTSQTNVLCYGNSTGIASVIPNGGTPSYTYLWSPNAATTASIHTLLAGTYSITVADSNGCTLDTTITITQPNSPLSLTALINPNSICDGDTANLTTTGSGGTPGYSYLWNNGTTTTNQTINPTVSSTYYVTVTDSNGCVTTDSVAINVKALPAPTVTMDSVCWGDTAIIWVNNANGGSIHWSDGETTDTIRIASLESTIYDSVYVIGTDGCRSAWVLDSATVSGPRITAGFTSDSTTGYAPLYVTFTNTSTNNYYDHWYFDDPYSGPFDSLYSVNAFHLFDSAGLYYVKLYAYNYDGCRDTITEVIDVKKTSSLLVYNVFTPNGDGKNDEWSPDFRNIATTHIEIFDRWGLKIKDWTTLTGWDGTNNGGSAVPDGTYYYVLTAQGVDNVNYNQHGFITLIR
jgi:gliding motility-associated-like protein